MTYNQKHLALLMTAAATLTLASSCKKEQTGLQENDKVGLLDDTPLKERDKYNSSVTLYHVNVPLYKPNGERIKDMYVLTRALSNKDFNNYDSQNQMSICRACFNGSSESLYVKVDENNAILTECGYVGLFAFNGRAVIVAEQNVSQFLGEIHKKRNYSYVPRRAASSFVEKNDSLDIGNFSYTEQDTLKSFEDTVSWRDSLKMSHIRPAVIDDNHQPVDTLQIIKPQRESYE